jgi:hypothetical protein
MTSYIIEAGEEVIPFQFTLNTHTCLESNYISHDELKSVVYGDDDDSILTRMKAHRIKFRSP